MKYILSILFLGLQFSQAQYALTFNPKKGSSYNLSMNSSFNLNTEMNGQKQTFNSMMTGIAKLDVKDVTDSGVVLEASFDSVHITSRTPMGKFEFTSDKSGQEAAAMNAMSKQHFTITLAKNGSVKKIHHPDTAGMSGMLSNFPGLDQIRKMLMMGNMRRGFNEKKMKENLEKITAIFPDKKVNLNEEWGYTITPDSNANHEIKTVYRLTSYQGGMATIKGTSTSKATGSEKQGGRMPANYQLDGNSEMTFTVDASTGWIKEATIKRNLTGHIEMKDKSNASKTIPIQLTIEANLTGQ
jgi:uncharacterized protein DUF6263